MEPEEEAGGSYPWLPPEDRLWRHPSEALSHPVTMVTAKPSSVTARRAWALAVVSGLIGALAASALGIAGGWWDRNTTVVRASFPAVPVVSLADAGAPGTDWTTIDDSVAPSVVEVTVTGPAGSAKASGVIILTAGSVAYVVTDGSILDDSYATSVRVSYLSGETVRGRVVGRDLLTGMALIEAANVDRDSAAVSGTVASLHDADPVLAVAARTSPTGSVFPGSVAAEDRTVPLIDGTDRDGLIAVTVAGMPATAMGGPVLDRSGRVVGVTVSVSAADPSNQQATFAVPIDEVLRMAGQVVAGEAPEHAWFGVADGEDVPSTVAHRYGVGGGVQAGLVEPGSPAADVGIHPSDIVTSFAGRPVVSTGALMAALASASPGHTVSIAWIDAGRSLRASLTLSPEPDDAGGS